MARKKMSEVIEEQQQEIGVLKAQLEAATLRMQTAIEDSDRETRKADRLESILTRLDECVSTCIEITKPISEPERHGTTCASVATRNEQPSEEYRVLEYMMRIIDSRRANAEKSLIDQRLYQ